MLTMWKPIILSVLTMVLCTLSSLTYAKQMVGYDFNQYSSKIYTGKKAPLKLGDWKMFKTRLKWAHQDGEIGFAGNYMVSIWGCGAGCISGAMIDKRTGIVYGLPIGEEMPYDFGCSHEWSNPLENERVVFQPNSRLFIVRNCDAEQIGNSNQYIEKYTYFVHVWDEKAKKFKLIKQVEKSAKTIQDW